MPNAAFAGAFLNTFIDEQQKERARKETNSRDVLNFLVSTGRVRDYNDLLPILSSMFPALADQKGKGKSGGGAAGKQQQADPNAILAQWLNPAFKMDQERRATEGATAGQPVTGSKPGGLFMSNAEVQQQTDTAGQHQADIQLGTFQKEQGIRDASAATAETRRETFESSQESKREAARIKEIQETNKGRLGSDLHQLFRAKQEAFELQNGRPPNADEDAQLMVAAREQWQKAGQKVTLPEAHTNSWLADAVKENKGEPLSPAQEKLERLKARKAWALAGQTDTLGRQEALAKFRQNLTALTPADLKELQQTVTVGDQTSNYLDVSMLSGKERAEAMAGAIRAGIVPVNAKQTDVLESAQAASKNLTGFLDQIKSKLPPDALNRPLTAIQNKLSAYFQTDNDLATAAAWNTTVIPMLRAIAASGLGRITNREIDLAEGARPKISDTVGKAAENVAIVEKILKNSIEPILTRGGSDRSATPRAAAPPPAAAGANSDAARRNKVRQRLLSNGYEATDATIDTYLKNNPDFK